MAAPYNASACLKSPFWKHLSYCKLKYLDDELRSHLLPSSLNRFALALIVSVLLKLIASGKQRRQKRLTANNAVRLASSD